MITIVDYGLGNIRAFENIFKRMHVDVSVARDASQLVQTDKIVLPGVGAFDHAMVQLNQSGMRGTLEHLVMERKVPVLGVCVGMQILAESSDEGVEQGLGWIPGTVRAFASLPVLAEMPMPHMGWNSVAANPDCRLFSGLESEPLFYFLHSYYFDNSVPDHGCAHAQYGVNFSCGVNFGNVYGVQFHPEKSHGFGATLLKNFAEL